MSKQQTTGCECGFPEPCPFIEGCEKVQRDDEADIASLMASLDFSREEAEEVVRLVKEDCANAE